MRRRSLLRGAGLTIVLLGHGGLVWAVLPALVPAQPAASPPTLRAVLVDAAPAEAPPPPALVVHPSRSPRAKPASKPSPSPRPAVAAAPVVNAPPREALPNAAPPDTAPPNAAPASADVRRDSRRSPALIACAKPPYPRESRRAGEAGTVQLRLLVDGEGRAAESRLERSSGFTRLDEAALAALAKCRFQPAAEGGRAEPSWVTLRYVWKLDARDGASP